LACDCWQSKPDNDFAQAAWCASGLQIAIAGAMNGTTFFGREHMRGMVMAALAVLLCGCAHDPAYPSGSMAQEASNAFVEGFVPTQEQVKNIARYPGWLLGHALGR
jgi:hypothetical protein